MLKNNYVRICITLILAILIVVYPFSIVLVVLPIIFYSSYAEGLFLGLLADSLYRFEYPYLYLSLIFVMIIVAEYIKRKIRV